MSDESPFDAIRHEDEVGEYWSARELSAILGYALWQNFAKVITQAQIACETSGYAVSDHFIEVNKMIIAGKGARRSTKDYKLSRYACYLVVQNADPEKEVVAIGQTYFAVQTRRQEMSQELISQMDEDQQRLFYREELARKNRRLAATATGAGVIKPRDFAAFQDHGYRGLYNGETARAIHERKGLEKGEHILDWMGSEELAANIFKATQADAKIKREGIVTVDGANAAHYAAGRAVRRAIEELGNTMPEDLPTPDRSIQEVERGERLRLERDAQTQRQPSLFGADEGEPGDDA